MPASGTHVKPASGTHLGYGTIERVEPTQAQIRAALKKHMAKLALRGARKGGKARAEALTPEQRREAARRAAQARWAKSKKRPT